MSSWPSNPSGMACLLIRSIAHHRGNRDYEAADFLRDKLRAMDFQVSVTGDDVAARCDITGIRLNLDLAMQEGDTLIERTTSG